MSINRIKKQDLVGIDMTDSMDKLLGNCPGTHVHTHTHTCTMPNLNGPRASVDSGATESAPLMGSQEEFKDGCHDSNMLDIIRFNIGGNYFQTSRSTLKRIPNTRLSRLNEDDPHYNPATGEWFYDRNPSLFHFILDFYRTDELHFPHNFCGPTIKNELIYWEIEEADIASCCWNRYRQFDEEKKIFQHIEEAFESKTLTQLEDLETAEVVNPTTWQVWRRRIFIFLEEPMSSRAAQTWTLMFLVFVLGSIGCLCIETVPKLRVPLPALLKYQARLQEEKLAQANYVTAYFNGSSDVSGNPSYVRVTEIVPNTTQSVIEAALAQTNPKLKLLFTTEPHPALEMIDSFCTCFFTIEFCIRFIVAPDRLGFIKSVMNIIDVLCVLPMWIKYIMLLYEVTIDMSLLPVFFIIMILRVLRICRVLRLARHYTGVKILLLALKASLRELLMLTIFVFIVILIFAVVIYYAEFFVIDTFSTIPDGYWWAIITLTTVGYGDMYPKSGMGYVVGAMCALTGILATGLPVPIIANNFNLYYSHASLMDAVASRKLQRDRKGEAEQAAALAIEQAETEEDIIMVKNGTPNKEQIMMKEATV